MFAISKIDASFEEEGGLVASAVASGRIVYAPVGPLNKDHSDVRSFAEAAEKGIKRYISLSHEVFMTIKLFL